MGIKPVFSLIFFIIEIILIFFLSRLAINELFYFLRIFIKNEKIIFSIVSLLFLPGTIVHELGHYFAATVLALRVYEVRIFPRFEKNLIKLGSVLYEKKDFIRGIFVGIFPLFFALFCFWMMAKFRLFPHEIFWMNIIFIYLIFSISSTMFSSKQDLVDLIYIIPLAIIILGIIYVFKLENMILDNQVLINSVLGFILVVNFYLFTSVITNLGLIIFLKVSRKILKK